LEEDSAIHNELVDLSYGGALMQLIRNNRSFHKDIHYYNYYYTEPKVSNDATDHACIYPPSTTK